MKRLQQVLAAGSLGACAALVAASFSNGTSAEAQSGSALRGQPVSFEAKLWDYLQTIQYRNWAPAAGQGLDAYPGKSPHGAFLKMYLNRVAASNAKSPPYGSIIIKENYGKDKKTLMAVTVMYRVKGYDAANNDWYWVKYKPDGTVARTPPDKGSKPIAGRFKSCINCHDGAAGDDYYFANDK
ncbi:MAG: cytochrome P460 family protein [Planctomycetaceae bacterium]